MDRFDSAQLGSTDKEKCPKCGMHKDGHCCRDEVKIVKLESSHFASEVSMPAHSLVSPGIIHTEFLLAPFRNYTENFITVEHGPPLSDQDCYVRNRVFRI